MPRLMSHPSTPLPQRGTFVGRVRELAEFRNSVRYVLGKEAPPGGSPLYPHIFLPHGEGGMGKSSLLRQFLRVASEEGMPADRITVVDLDYQSFPTPEALAQLLVHTICRQHSDFDQRYRQARARRDELTPCYRDLERQWTRWEALRGASDSDINGLFDAHRRTLTQTEIQRAQFGAYEPVYLATQAEQALDELAALQVFRDERGHAPSSFDELLQRELGSDAALFGAQNGLGQALADDLYALAETEPLLLTLDTYERADQYDDWLRTTILANSSDRMFTIIAGRNQHDDDYRRTFSGEFANLVRSYNLNEQTLHADEICEYLKLRLKLPGGPPDELVTEAQAISRGIPVALEALGDQLASGDDLSPYREMEFTALDRRAVVHTVTQRFLRYALSDKSEDAATRVRKSRDRQCIRALSLLLAPDAELACAIWGVAMDQGRQIVEDLAGRYSFIFAGYGPYEMHDLVHEFVRADTLADGRNSFDWPVLEAGMRRILLIVDRRIGQSEQQIVDFEVRYAHNSWRNMLLDRVNALVWLGEYDEAERLILNRGIEAIGSHRLVTTRKTTLISEYAPVTADLKLLAEALQTSNYTQLEAFVHILEPRAHAILLYLRSQQSQVTNITDENDLQQLQQTIGWLEQAYALEATWPPISTALSEAYAMRGNYRRHELHDFIGAIADYECAIARQPDNLTALFGRGVARLNMGNYTDALADFDCYLTIRSKYPNPFYFRGRTKHNLGDMSGALADYDRALELRPEDPRTLRQRGNVRFDLGDYAGALADYDQAIELLPSDPALLSVRGRLKLKIGDLVGASADYDSLLKLSCDDPVNLYYRGTIKRSLKDLKGALADFELSLVLRPDHTKTIEWRGYTKGLLGDLEGALNDLTHVVDLNPNDASAVHSIACIYATHGQIELALNWLERAIRISEYQRYRARTDSDFDPIRADPRFIALVGVESRTGNRGTAEAAE